MLNGKISASDPVQNEYFPLPCKYVPLMFGEKNKEIQPSQVVLSFVSNGILFAPPLEMTIHTIRHITNKGITSLCSHTMGSSYKRGLRRALSASCDQPGRLVPFTPGRDPVIKTLPILYCTLCKICMLSSTTYVPSFGQCCCRHYVYQERLQEPRARANPRARVAYHVPYPIIWR